jgi:hypothetical protein
MTGGAWLRGALAAAVALAARAEPTVLTVGMELRYESNGRAGAPWKVESVERDLAIAGRTGCLRVRFAPGGPRAGPDVRITCEDAGTLWSLDTVSGTWKPSRPLAVGGVLESIPAARSAHYTVNGESTVGISGYSLRVLETVVLTIDSTGTAVRRLRERYAPALGTATWGAFEVPDGDGWKVQQEFRLTAISPARTR